MLQFHSWGFGFARYWSNFRLLYLLSLFLLAIKPISRLICLCQVQHFHSVPFITRSWSHFSLCQHNEEHPVIYQCPDFFTSLLLFFSLAAGTGWHFLAGSPGCPSCASSGAFSLYSENKPAWSCIQSKRQQLFLWCLKSFTDLQQLVGVGAARKVWRIFILLRSEQRNCRILTFVLHIFIQPKGFGDGNISTFARWITMRFRTSPEIWWCPGAALLRCGWYFLCCHQGNTRSEWLARAVGKTFMVHTQRILMKCQFIFHNYNEVNLCSLEWNWILLLKCCCQLCCATFPLMILITQKNQTFLYALTNNDACCAAVFHFSLELSCTLSHVKSPADSYLRFRSLCQYALLPGCRPWDTWQDSLPDTSEVSVFSLSHRRVGFSAVTHRVKARQHRSDTRIPVKQQSDEFQYIKGKAGLFQKCVEAELSYHDDWRKAAKS